MNNIPEELAERYDLSVERIRSLINESSDEYFAVNPMDCSPPGSSTHGIFQARVLEWGAIAFQFSSVHFSSVAQLCPTLCDPMNRSTPGLPVHHQLPEFTQTHIHRVSDAIQPSHSVVPFSSCP